MVIREVHNIKARARKRVSNLKRRTESWISRKILCAKRCFLIDKGNIERRNKIGYLGVNRGEIIAAPGYMPLYKYWNG